MLSKMHSVFTNDFTLANINICKMDIFDFVLFAWVWRVETDFPYAALIS